MSRISLFICITSFLAAKIPDLSLHTILVNFLADESRHCVLTVLQAGCEVVGLTNITIMLQLSLLKVGIAGDICLAESPASVSLAAQAAIN